MPSARFITGTSGWSYKDWVGPFYPDGTNAKDYLAHYSKDFHAVEIDSTFYAIPASKTVKNWEGKVPADFIFCPKFPRLFTHDKKLKDCDKELEMFWGSISNLGHKLGPIVLQFEYTFQFKDHQLLGDFLKKIPAEYRVAVEIRHRSWLNEQFYDLLRENKAALVLADLYYMPRNEIITADFTYVRLLGNRKQIPDDFSHVRIDRKQDLQWWAEKIREFLSKEVDVYAFANNRYQGHAPATVRSIRELVG